MQAAEVAGVAELFAVLRQLAEEDQAEAEMFLSFMEQQQQHLPASISFLGPYLARA